MRFVSFILLAMLLPFVHASAETHATFNEQCLLIQNKLYTLQLSEAEKLIKEEEKLDSNNLTTSYLEVIHDLLKVLVSESPAAFKHYHQTSSKALKRFKASEIKNGYSTYFQEEVHFYNSVVHGKAGSAVSAANEVRLAYNYGEKLIAKHPNFLAGYKTLGLIHAGFGNLPASYRKLVSMLGYSGSTDMGIKELQKFTTLKTERAEWIWMQKEAELYLAAIHLYLKNDKKKAWEMTAMLTNDFQVNPLLTFVRANFADKCKRNDEIIHTIQNKPVGSEFESIPYLNFLMGTAKLQKLDDGASIYLLKYLTQHEGSSYVKSCYQKLAWTALLKSDTKGYKSYMSKLKLNGAKNLEEDQQAQMEANRNTTPDARLLKSRLLFDGGYYQEALNIIRPLRADDFTTDLLKTEYCYRKARIYHQTGADELATAFYKAAILTGKSLTVYYASYSALYMGELFEKQENVESAKSYFQKATSFKSNREYQKSVEHRAKAGLHRLK